MGSIYAGWTGNDRQKLGDVFPQTDGNIQGTKKFEARPSYKTKPLKSLADKFEIDDGPGGTNSPIGEVYGGRR
jgi:hypothetical protein